MVRRRLWEHALDGIVGGAGLGLFHAALLSVGGLYHLATPAEILFSLARFAGLLGLTGGAMGLLYGVTLGRLKSERLQKMRSAWILPASAYLVIWTLLLAKELWRRHEFLPPVFWETMALVVALAVLVVVHVLYHGSRKRGASPVPGGRSPLLFAISVLGCLLLAAAPVLRPGPPSAEPLDKTTRTLTHAPVFRNVLLLTIDTLRADHLGCYGYPRNTSPAIDALAASGVRFENALCQRPKTSPSFATLFTGKYPSSHGVHRPMQVLADRNRTIAQILSERGWRTGAVVTNANLFPEFGFSKGFQIYAYGFDTAREVSDNALAWLETNAKLPEPWFLWVHYTDPHTPYDPPPPYDALFGEDSLHVNHPHRPLVNWYDGEIRLTDDQLRRVLDWIDASGLRESTLVVFTADHGESLGEHHYYYDHGLNAYEPSARIPLIFSGPRVPVLLDGGGIPEGAVSEALVGNVDLLPTLLSFLRVPPPDDLEGTDVSYNVLGPGNTGPQEFVFHDAGYGFHTECGMTQSVRRSSSKFVHRLRDWARYPSQPGVVLWTMDALLEGGLAPDELYDLAADPRELVNLVHEDPSRARRELQVLQEAAARIAQNAVDLEGMGPEDLDPETYKRLKSLGYIR